MATDKQDYRAGVSIREISRQYKKLNGEITHYTVKNTEFKSRKITLTDEDFDAFLSQLSLGKTQNEAAKLIKVALTAAVKKSIEKCLEHYVSKNIAVQ